MESVRGVEWTVSTSGGALRDDLIRKHSSIPIFSKRYEFSHRDHMLSCRWTRAQRFRLSESDGVSALWERHTSREKTNQFPYQWQLILGFEALFNNRDIRFNLLDIRIIAPRKG